MGEALTPYYEHQGIRIYVGDCREILPELSSIGAIVCDPPYGLEMMGLKWDKLDVRQPNDETFHKSGSGPHDRAKVRHSSSPSYGGSAGNGMQQWHYLWALAALKAVLPGAHMVAFGGTRTFHRLTCAVEDAGWEIRDCLMWLYGSGFPKSLDVSKAIDKAAGAEREVVGKSNRCTGPSQAGDNGIGTFKETNWQDSNNLTAPATDAAKQWDGFGTALKPAWEPIILARKQLDGTVARNVQEHGVGALNIDACRIEGPAGNGVWGSSNKTVNPERTFVSSPGAEEYRTEQNPAGRWPANVILDEESGAILDQQTGILDSGPEHELRRSADKTKNAYGEFKGREVEGFIGGDFGGASRFYYCAKADRGERERYLSDLPLKQFAQSNGAKAAIARGEEYASAGEEYGVNVVKSVRNDHPTVKPIDLMRWLIKLVCPPGVLICDPFMGSGTTLIAAKALGHPAIGIEQEEKWAEVAAKRLSQDVLQF